MERRVLVIEDKHVAKTNNTCAIQIEFTNGRAACWRQADEAEMVRTPGEMFMPTVPARMKAEPYAP